ncbi:MAG: hypothetical protein V4750_06070 [Pseudomonadota bacterium]
MAPPERTIRAVDVGSPQFRKCFKRIRDPRMQRQIADALKSLYGINLDAIPKRLHLHPLTNKLVPSVLDPHKKVPAWSFHVIPGTHKASFTLENGTAYMRVLASHAEVDKNP